MLMPFLFLAVFLAIITTPGLIALSIEDRRRTGAGEAPDGR